MKIAFTGGGTGGHFYPIIAVAEEVRRIADEQNLLPPQLYFIGPDPYDKRVLFENDIQFRRTPAGKVRRYFSLMNLIDPIKTAFGIIRAVVVLFSVYPDVIFSKGGYASFPTLYAARILRIPVFIHESDAVPGRVNTWSAKFAYRIAVSYPEAAQYFKDVNAVFTGTPVRKDVAKPAVEGAHEYLDLSKDIPTILVLGGSQGAQKINEAILSILPELLTQYQIIHQTGEKNIVEVEETARVILEKSEHRNRYKVFGFLNDLALRMSAGAAALVVSRAGSTSIFEIASWKKPSIVIPLPKDVAAGDHQRKNAFSYARKGAAIVLEQENLTPHLLESEIDRLMQNPNALKDMSKKAEEFGKPDAAARIAGELIEVALEHES